MGCDIHPWIQYREEGSTYWHTWSGEMNWGRNYDFFDALAGVRCRHDLPGNYQKGNCPTTVSAPRGWPEDSGSLESWGESAQENVDFHTPSWLTLDEFKKAVLVSGGLGPETDAAIAAMEALAKGNRSVRLVFAFDN
jgi:hypothetical protein